MSGVYDLQIQTIYVSSGAASATPRPLRLRVIGLLTLIVSVVWLAATWGPVWRWIGQELVFGGAALQGGVHATVVKPDAGDGDTGAPGSDAAEHTSTKKTNTIMQSQIMLVSLAGAWLGVATIVGLWLAMSAVVALGVGRFGRPVGIVLAPLALIVFALLAWYVEREFDWAESIMPRWVLPALIGLGIVFAASIGSIFRRHGVGMLRAGGLFVILSAAFSVCAIWSVLNWGDLPANPVSGVKYAQVFAVQSAYGWLLLLSSIGLR